MTQQGFGIVPRSFSLSEVIGVGVPLLRRNFWHFFAIAFIVGIPLIVFSLLLAQIVQPGPPVVAAAGPEAGAIHVPSTGEAVLSAAVFFVAALTYFVIQSAINFGTLQDLRGERTTVGRCIGRGLSVLPRILVAALLLFGAMFLLTFIAALVVYALAMAVAAATGQGFSIAVVSAAAAIGVLGVGMFLIVTWWVFVPAIVVENAGPVACFRRSRFLTKGHRWSIFGILLLVFLANFGCSIVVAVIAQFGAIATAALLNVVVALAFSALSSVLTAVGYYALRAEKESFGPGDLARAFDQAT